MDEDDGLSTGSLSDNVNYSSQAIKTTHRKQGIKDATRTYLPVLNTLKYTVTAISSHHKVLGR